MLSLCLVAAGIRNHRGLRRWAEREVNLWRSPALLESPDPKYLTHSLTVFVPIQFGLIVELFLQINLQTVFYSTLDELLEISFVVRLSKHHLHRAGRRTLDLEVYERMAIGHLLGEDRWK